MENTIMTQFAFGDVCEMMKREAPMRFRVVKFGNNAFTKSDNQGSFEFTPELAEMIVNEFKKRGKDIVIDFEHGTLNQNAAANGDAPAAGWGGNLEVDEDGLYVVISNWTDKGKNRLESGEYRYHSPVFKFDQGRPCALHSIALTTHPALHDLDALVAANDTEGEMDMDVQEEKQDEVTVDYFSDVKDAISEMKKVSDEIADSMHELLEEAFEHASSDEAVLKDLQEFSDSMFCDDEIKAFADINTMINNAKTDKTGPQYYEFLKEALSLETSEEGKKQIKQAITALEEFKKAFPVLYLAGFTSGNEATLETFKKIQPKLYAYLEKKAKSDTLAMDDLDGLYDDYDSENESYVDNDFREVLGLSDTSKAEEVKSKIQALVDGNSALNEFLKLYDVESLDDLKETIEAKEKNAKEEIKKLTGNLALSEATLAVESELSSPRPRITEAQKDAMIKMYVRDKEEYKEFLSKSPVSFNDERVEPESVSKDVPKVVMTTEADRQAAEAFGLTPEYFAEARMKNKK